MKTNCSKTCSLLLASLIPLTKNKYAIVDMDDYEWLAKWRWYADRSGSGLRASRNRPIRDGSRALVLMHREIMGLKPGDKLQVDHVHHNTLDNRKSGLRVCSAQENQMNQLAGGGTSRYKGVSFHEKTNKWRSRIFMNRKEEHIGMFASESDAAKAYNKKAKELFGDFACLNKIA